MINEISDSQEEYNIAPLPNLVMGKINYDWLIGEYEGQFLYNDYQWDLTFSIQDTTEGLIVLSRNDSMLKYQEPMYRLTYAGVKTTEDGKEVDFSIDSLPEYTFKVLLNKDGSVSKIVMDSPVKMGAVFAFPKK